MKELGKPGGSVTPDHDTHRVRRLFAKAVDSQRGESAVEIIGAEREMRISTVNVSGSEGTLRIEGQMHLQVAATEPGAGALEGRPLNDPEAEKILIESERPR